MTIENLIEDVIHSTLGEALSEEVKTLHVEEKSFEVSYADLQQLLRDVIAKWEAVPRNTKILCSCEDYH